MAACPTFSAMGELDLIISFMFPNNRSPTTAVFEQTAGAK
jgi:hypothetical protein